jgi:hypothetical protein
MRLGGMAVLAGFLFAAHGFRGKARFVLLPCCTCEGSQAAKIPKSLPGIFLIVSIV